MASSNETAEEERTACVAAEKFCKLYYEAMDKRRHMVHHMYTDSASMVWNGNPIVGAKDIEQWLNNLPSTEYTIRSLDAQQLPKSLTENQNSIMILTGGQVFFGSTRNYTFTQTFLLASLGEGTLEKKWKIASDRFRFID